MGSLLKTRGKLILGILFIVMALTPALINPLINIIVALANGMKIGIGDIPTLWQNITVMSWITSSIYLAMGIQFIIQQFVPATTPPKWVYAIIFGIFALFGLFSFIANSVNLIRYISNENFKAWDTSSKARWILSIIGSLFNLLGHVIMLIGLLVRGKGKMFTIISIVFFATSGALNILSYVLHIAYLNQMVSSYNVLAYIPPSYIVNIIYSIVYVASIALFCYLFIFNPYEKATASKTVDPTVEEVEMEALNVDEGTGE